MNTNKNEGGSQLTYKEQARASRAKLKDFLQSPDEFYFSTRSDGRIFFDTNGEPMPTKEKLKQYRDFLNKIIQDYKNQAWGHGKLLEQREREKNIFYRKVPKPRLVGGFVYLLKSDGYYKIGKTIKLKDRLVRYESENPHPIEVVYKKFVNDYTKSEEKLLKKFADSKFRGEWFRFTKKQVDEVISEINKM